jgi:mono/diheme cytochrome c family protein
MSELLVKKWNEKIKYLFVLLLIGCAALILSACGKTDAKKQLAGPMYSTPESMGKYLVTIGGCNDCHTPGYLETEGNLPESEWLVGSPVGFKGPWGTTYAANLRLSVARMTEDAFVSMAQTRNTLPPMPWPSLHKMEENHLRAIYKYIISLGEKGVPAPEFVSADKEPETPYFVFVPLHMERLGQSAQK